MPANWIGKHRTKATRKQGKEKEEEGEEKKVGKSRIMSTKTHVRSFFLVGHLVIKWVELKIRYREVVEKKATYLSFHSSNSHLKILKTLLCMNQNVSSHFQNPNFSGILKCEKCYRYMQFGVQLRRIP